MKIQALLFTFGVRRDIISLRMKKWKRGKRMRKYLLKIIGLIMVGIAIIFVIFALWHPEMSFPWDNTITWTLYGTYVIVTVAFFIIPTKKK
jgi:peptidoglycan/LPS O-acetylase OafA/YrhL